MPQEEPARIARELASHGYAADREAITLLAGAEDPETALVVAVEATPDDALKLSAADVRDVLETNPRGRRDPIPADGETTPDPEPVPDDPGAEPEPVPDN
ncbi:DNA polymerase II, partial [Halobacteriales archaeon QH_10_70_21]